MSDLKVSLSVEAVADDAVRDIDKAVKKLNELEKSEERQAVRQGRLNRLQSESARLARELRTSRERELSTEERLTRLRERRATVEDRLARAQGNELRTAALRQRLLQIDLARNRLAQGSGAGGGFLGGISSRLGLSGGIGMAGAVMLLSGVLAVPYLAYRQVRATLNDVDNISDTAEQLGISRVQMLALQNAAAKSGVRSGTMGRSLSTFAQARSSALSGDATMTRVFANYGVTQADLRSSLTNVDLMRQVAKSLGTGGMTPADAGPLGKLLGQQPGRMLSMLGKYEETPGMADALGKVDKLNSVLEQLTQAVRELSIRMVSTWSRALPALAGVLAAIFPTQARQLLNATAPDPTKPAAAAAAATPPNDPRTAGNPLGLLNEASVKKQRAPLVMSSDDLAKRGFYLGVRNPDQQRALLLAEAQLNTARAQLAELQTLNRDE